MLVEVASDDAYASTFTPEERAEIVEMYREKAVTTIIRTNYVARLKKPLKKKI